MSHFIIGGRTEYSLSNNEGDPTYGEWTTQWELQQIEDWLHSLGDPNFQYPYDLYEEWGEVPVLWDQGGGRFPTSRDNNGSWLDLVAVGKTNISGYGDPIWYRTFFVFTNDAQTPNALQIVGGKQLFWQQQQHVVSDYEWGTVTPSWVGIGISGDSLKPEPGSVAGRVFFDQNIAGGDYFFLTDWDPAYPGDQPPDPLEIDAMDVPINRYQLVAIAKHDPFGWCLSQVRLYTLPATAENPNRIGSYHLGLVGWIERVGAMDGPLDFVSNNWGRSSTEVSHRFIGQWWTPQHKWGQSAMDLHFAPE